MWKNTPSDSPKFVGRSHPILVLVRLHPPQLSRLPPRLPPRQLRLRRLEWVALRPLQNGWLQPHPPNWKGDLLGKLLYRRCPGIKLKFFFGSLLLENPPRKSNNSGGKLMVIGNKMVWGPSAMSTSDHVRLLQFQLPQDLIRGR